VLLDYKQGIQRPRQVTFRIIWVLYNTLIVLIAHSSSGVVDTRHHRCVKVRYWRRPLKSLVARLGHKRFM
jgi:hypothetical protein